MERDQARYPHDDNGDVLWRMVEGGDDLAIPRDIDFVLDFTEKDDALRCGMFLLEQEMKIQLEPPLEDEPDSPWSLLVIPTMVPEHAQITHFEQYLQQVAAHYGGECSGWGCMQQA